VIDGNVELFETTGKVELAEIFFDSNVPRSPAWCSLRWLPKPSVYVLPSGHPPRFLPPPHPVSAFPPALLTLYAAKFQQYMHGGRPL